LPSGDIDGNNVVDLGDYFILAGAWYASNPAADIDGSGWVDLEDYFLLSNHWQEAGDPRIGTLSRIADGNSKKRVTTAQRPTAV